MSKDEQLTPRDNKKMVLESLSHLDMSDDNVIEMLLLLLDDWEVRAAVMANKSKRVTAKVETFTQTQTVSNKEVKT